MNNGPIGIFDSGVGGLTVMAEIRKSLPFEDLIYFGDTAHVPYGSKSPEVVTNFSLAIASFLLSQNVKMIVVACNTASAFALNKLKKKFSVPVIGVIEPGARLACEISRSGRIGVIGTEGTIKSKSYLNALHRLKSSIKVFSKACPLFVPLVEEGWLNHDVTKMVAREYLHVLNRNKIDALVLGCTHYPLIKEVVQNALGGKIALVDSAQATAKEVCAVLEAKGLSSERKQKGRFHFFVSDAPKKFQIVGERFLGYPVTPVTKVHLE